MTSAIGTLGKQVQPRMMCSGRLPRAATRPFICRSHALLQHRAAFGMSMACNQTVQSADTPHLLALAAQLVQHFGELLASEAVSSAAQSLAGNASAEAFLDDAIC